MLNVLNPLQNDLSDFANMGAYVYNLAYMVKSQKVNVPTFICIPNDEIFYSLNEETKEGIWRILSDLKYNNISVEIASKKCIELLNNVKLSRRYLNELSTIINQCFSGLGDIQFVVKNSFYWTDNIPNGLISNNSVGSCINVNYNSIADAILCAYSSIYAEQILEIVKQSNFSITFPKNNIIVQVMLPVDVSGIAYSSNSIDGILNERLVTAKFGRNVESDEIITENYHCNSSDGQFYTEGLTEYELLTPLQIQNLITQTNFIMDGIGKDIAINVKFVVANDQVYVLNVFPDDHPKMPAMTILDGKSIDTRRKDTSSNLSLSVFNDFENRTTKALFYNIYKLPNFYEENKQLLDNRLIFYKNNPYYDVSKTNALFRCLPYDNILIPQWRNKVLVSNMNMPLPEPKGNLSQLKAKQKKITKQLLKSSQGIFTEINNAFGEILKQYNDNINLLTVRKLHEELLTNVVPQIAYNRLNKTLLTTTMDDLTNNLAKANVDNQTIAAIINELTCVDNSPYGKLLASIANIVQSNQAILTAFYQIDSKEKFIAFMNNQNDLTNMINEFFYKYGNLTIDYNKIESITYNENPIAFIEEVLRWQRPTNNVLSNANIQKIVSKKPFAEYIANIKVLHSNDKTFEMYERIFNGTERMLFLRMGVLYQKQGLLQAPIDIVFMTLKEIFVDEGTQKTNIDKRKEQYQNNLKIPTFSKLVFDKEIK